MPRMKLTKSVIDNLAASGKDVVYWDAACPGFGVKVTPAGRVTTQVSLSRALEFGDEPFWVCGEGVEHIPTLFFRR